MSFLSRLLSSLSGHSSTGSAQAAPSVRSPKRVENARVIGNALEVESPDFRGDAHVSPNQRWVLGCDDSDGKGRRGFRTSGNGRTVLVEMSTGRVASEARDLARPSEAAVSDVGTYVVADSGFGDSLSGRIHVRSQSGEQLYSRPFAANIYSVGISDCGQYVVVQTCHAPSGPDGNLLEVHDVVRKQPLFSVKPATPWSRAYAFDVEVDRLAKLWVIVDKLGRCAYDGSGSFLDHQGLMRAELNSPDVSTRLPAAQRLLQSSTSPAELETVLSVAEVAMKMNPTLDDGWVAKAVRLQGEALEALGRGSEAVAASEKALCIDPKIGVKKKLVALRKKLGSQA